MAVTSIYAALLVLLFVALSVRTLRLRGSLRISLGDGGNPQMLRAIRVHANFAEYAPLGLLVLLLLETQRAEVWLLHGLGLCLLCGRVLHAYGVGQPKAAGAFRVAGMALTLTMLTVSAVALMLYAIRAGVT